MITVYNFYYLKFGIGIGEYSNKHTGTNKKKLDYKLAICSINNERGV